MTLRQRLSDVVPVSLFEEAAETDCKACGANNILPFFEVKRTPTQTCVLLDTQDEAIAYPVGEVLLGFCTTCGFIQNVRFDPDLVDYSKPTEESQAFSQVFQSFASKLADDLVERYDLVGKTVLEVGCGKGDFLVLLAERGIASGLGVDPGFLPNRPEAAAASLSFSREFYGEHSTSLTGDLVLTRHLMEHVPNVGEFFGWLAESVAKTPGAALFTEVPDTLRVLDEGAFWDVYYEHCSYFTMGSLRRAIESVGLAVDHACTGFNDQYLLCGASPGQVETPGNDDMTRLESAIWSFAATATTATQTWRSRILDRLGAGSRVAVWGGGSKAVAFLAGVDVDDVTVVDINPHKQGKWLPSMPVQVQPPAALLDAPPDLVIPMNPIYVDEISADLDRMGILAEVSAV